MENPRRRRLVAYFERELKGDRATLIRRSGLTHGRISQLFDPLQPFGELSARRLAESLGLSSDYFERDHDAAPQLSPEALALAQAYDSANAEIRERLHALMRAVGLLPTSKHGFPDEGADTEDRRPQFGVDPGESALGDLREIPSSKQHKGRQ